MIILFRNVKARIIRVLETVVAIVMGALVLDVLWQIVVRSLTKLLEPLSRENKGLKSFLDAIASLWTEELAIVLLIWVVLLGACVAFDRKKHLGVDFFVGKLPNFGQRFLAVVVHLCTAAFACCVLIYGGGEVVRLVLINKQPLPALGIQMGYVYLALPISGLLILLTSVEGLLETVFNADTENKGEEA